MWEVIVLDDEGGEVFTVDKLFTTNSEANKYGIEHEFYLFKVKEV
jgi:hypothetical protein